MIQVSQKFADRIIATFGAAGREWLDNIPAILNKVIGKWSLELKPPFKNLSYSYVLPAKRKGEDVVLKLGIPDTRLETEIRALKLFDGKGIVKLIDSDEELGALLIERLIPGKPISVLRDDDEWVTREAGKIMSLLHGSLMGKIEFPTVADWAMGLKRLRKTFEGKTGPFPVSIVEKAEGVFNELLDSMENATVLHGDLHHGNILSSQRGPWLAIDPKGVVGEPAYETGAWLRNPFPDLLYWDNPGKTISRRVNQFATEFEFDRERIIGWGFCQAVLAAWWGFEDNDDDWTKWLSIAQLIHTIT